MTATTDRDATDIACPNCGYPALDWAEGECFCPVCFYAPPLPEEEPAAVSEAQLWLEGMGR